MLTLLDFREDAGFLALALEATQGLLEGFIFANMNNCGHTPSPPLRAFLLPSQPRKREYYPSLGVEVNRQLILRQSLL